MPFEVLGRIEREVEVTPCLSDLLEEWLSIKDRVLCPEAARGLRYLTGRWRRCLGDLPASEVGTREIQRLYAERDRDGRANATLNRERGRLREFWRWLRALEYTSADPVALLAVWPTKNLRKRKRRYVHVTVEWQERILAELRERFRRYFVFHLYTGLRYGEIRALLWDWISEDGVLTIPAEFRKQGESHRLPLPARVLAVLGPPGPPGTLVFPGLPTHGNMGTALKRAGRRAGFPGAEFLSTHQLRRSWRVRLVKANVPREVIKDLGGWTKDAVLAEYYWTKVSDAEARAYLERI